MTAPVRLRLSRRPRFDLQAESLATNGLPVVLVARPSHHGNPYPVDSVRGAMARSFDWAGRCTSPLWLAFMSERREDEQLRAEQDALARSVAIVLFAIELRRFERRDPAGFQAWLRPLRGRNLACWCAADAPCHADVLLELANRPVCEEVG